MSGARTAGNSRSSCTQTRFTFVVARFDDPTVVWVRDFRSLHEKCAMPSTPSVSEVPWEHFPRLLVRTNTR
jgi:hypothetical protein